MLPKEDFYAPPMNIKVKDHRSFGRKPIVGFHVIKSLKLFRCDPTTPSLAFAQIISIYFPRIIFIEMIGFSRTCFIAYCSFE